MEFSPFISGGDAEQREVEGFCGKPGNFPSDGDADYSGSTTSYQIVLLESYGLLRVAL